MFIVVLAAGQDEFVQSVMGRVATHKVCHCTSVHNIVCLISALHIFKVYHVDAILKIKE